MKKINFKSRIHREMKLFFFSLFLLFLFCLFENNFSLQSYAREKSIQEKQLYAKAAVLMDAESGRVLFGKNENEVLPMASTTKILTCIIALENCEMNEVVSVSKYASSMPDVQLHIREGEKYYLGDLLYSLMLESHNDVAVAIAEHVSGSVEKFAELMNQQAKKIGCKNSCFVTPNGLDGIATKVDSNGNETELIHSTSAKDLALIMSYCILKSDEKDMFLEITGKNHYEFTDLTGKRNFSCNNHNALLVKMKDALSGKTGFTAKAGYCYVGAIENDGRYFVVSLLACGWPFNKNYKWSDCEKLFSYGKTNYRRVEADLNMKEMDIPKQIKVYNGQFPIGTKEEERVLKLEVEDFLQRPSVLLKEDEKWDVQIMLPSHMEAPVCKGKTIGKIIFSVGGELEFVKDIKAKTDIKRNNYFYCLKEIFIFFLQQF